MSNTNDSFVGKKFQRVGKDVFVVVTDYQEKTKTVIIEFPNGKTMSITTSTLNNPQLWQPYEGELPEAEKPETERYIPGTPEQEPTILENTDNMHKPHVQRGNKPLGRPKKSEEKKSRAKPNLCPDKFDTVISKIASRHKCELKTNPKLPNVINFRFNNICILSIYKGKSGYKISFRPEAQSYIPYPSYVVNNYMLAGTIKASYLDDYKSMIDVCVSKSIKYLKEAYLPNKTKKKSKKEEN